jgi:glycosyltransferase involved in cell wall biosynthesis
LPKISIVTNGHFCTNPRVWKEADALAAAGHRVTVFGIWFDARHADLDLEMLGSRKWSYETVADLRKLGLKSNAAWHWQRTRSKVGKLAAHFNWRDANALGYAPAKLLKAASSASADLTIGHLELGLWVCQQLAQRGFNVGADFEDWHSENSLPADLNGNAAHCRMIEKDVLRSCSHVTTTSQALAGALAESFSVQRPEVIYNSVPTVKVEPQRSGGCARLLWLSQTLGQGRGLEDLCAALPAVKGEWRLGIIANASAEAKQWLYSLLPSSLHSRIEFLGTFSPDQLNNAVAAFDIGLALETPGCRNKDLTASNKIFQYLQSGLFVVASDTAGQREVLNKLPAYGSIYESNDSSALAARLNEIISRPDLVSLRSQIQLDANRQLAYELQSPTLLMSVERALSKRV